MGHRRNRKQYSYNGFTPVKIDMDHYGVILYVGDERLMEKVLWKCTGIGDGMPHGRDGERE
jgi:hypothetical protein